ncbi:hypothetical protein AB0D27_07175 [Streptomyces sp. NPDC048415]|uniref:hypothetical protein n=1 Tax=Streptomyces sp. NPDC048415 TaxID=3154822 RepID=UPI003424CD42
MTPVRNSTHGRIPTQTCLGDERHDGAPGGEATDGVGEQPHASSRSRKGRAVPPGRPAG